jgi:ComEC/Rec2-related protein
MNRGFLSYFSLLALFLWLSIFLSGAVPWFLFPLVGLLFAAGALPTLSLRDARWRRAGMVLGFAGLGLVLGCAATPATARWHRHLRLFAPVPAHSPVALHRIGSYRGIMMGDTTAMPVPTAAEAEDILSRYPVRLTEVASVDGQIRGSARGSVLLRVAGGPMLLRGQEVTVVAGLAAAREPGRFDYDSRAVVHQVLAGGFPKRIDSVRAALYSGIRRRLRRLDPDAAALLEALLLGRREALEQSLYERFRSSGSLHLLALSGLHLGILYLLLCLLLRFLGDPRLRRLVAGGFLLGYLFLVGWRPSLERAAVMLLIGAVGYALDRDLQPLNLLGLSGAVLLLIHPHYAFDLSFQLSFASLAAILLLSPHLLRIWKTFLPAFLGRPLAVSLSAQIGTAPLVLFHYGAIYPVGVAAALVLIPLAGLYLAAGILFLGVSFLELTAGSVLPFGAMLEGAVGELISLGYRGIALCLSLFSRVPGWYPSWKPLFWLLLAVPLIPSAVEAWRWRSIHC